MIISILKHLQECAARVPLSVRQHPSASSMFRALNGEPGATPLGQVLGLFYPKQDTPSSGFLMEARE
jgi:hypothetical protein